MKLLPRTDSLLCVLSLFAVGCQAPSEEPAPEFGVAPSLEIVALESLVFGNTRNLRVWLPPGYREPANSERLYPVLFLNDGQNLFDSATALFGSNEWHVDEIAAELVEAGRISPIVVVGIDNAGRSERAREYLPYPDEFLDPPEPNPQGDLYGEFLAEEVIPFVERHFRIRHGSRVLGGSSYGALVSMHVAISRPGLFAGLLLESPSFYVDDNHVLEEAAVANLGLDRVYLGVGTNELALKGCPEHPGNEEAVEGVRRMAGILRDAGLRDGSQIMVTIEPCAEHDEDAWAGRLPAALSFLFPPGAAS